MELIRYSKENSDYQLLRAYIYDQVASVLISDMIEEEKGNYILRNAFNWYERYLTDYIAFIDEAPDTFSLGNAEYMTSKELLHAGVMIEFALSIMRMSVEDIHYSYAIEFLEDKICQNYSKLEDVNLTHSLEFKRIIEETLEHLEYLKEIEEDLDTLQVVINGLPDRRDANDASHP